MSGGSEDGPVGGAHQFLSVVRQGRSFSGRERHCCFLNAGNSYFADVSALSGLDVPDDGRGVAQVDWDADGDLDYWVSNRNGPQLRFFRNDLPSRGHFLFVHLEGKTCNRDAIGARVRLFLRPSSGTSQAPHAPLCRTLRAGSGFLAQSSKWLHFGLADQQIDRLEVGWPDGSTEIFKEIPVDSRIRIQQGSNEAVAMSARQSTRELPAEPFVTAATSANSSAMCFSMIPLPASQYVGLDGQRHAIVTATDRLVLLNLWATWCHPCVVELDVFKRHEKRLGQAGLRVVALSVDGINPQGGTSDSFDKFIGDHRFPFALGHVDDAMMTKLQLLNNTIFELHTPLPLPVSFLLDKKYRVCAVYKGAVSVDQLLADARKLRSETTHEWRMATLPLAGRWIMPPRRRQLFPFVQQLAERGFAEEGASYIALLPEMFTSQPDWPLLALKLGEEFELRGQYKPALAYYGHAVQRAPSHVPAVKRLASLLATCPETDLRDATKALSLASQAERLSQGQDPEAISILAAAYAGCGRLEKAIVAAERAAALAESMGSEDLLRNIRSQLDRYRQ